MPYCTSCGAEAAEGQRYCERCGEPIEVPVVMPAPPLPPFPSPEVEREDLRTHEPFGERASRAAQGIAGGPSGPAQPAGVPPVPAVPAPRRKKRSAAIALVAVLLLAVAGAAVIFVILPILTTGSTAPPEDPGTTPDPVTVIPTPETTATPQPTPTVDPYAAIALPLKTMFSYNIGEKYASRATVYRYWINGTYQWHNDKDNRYYPQRPRPGNKYLFVYVVVVNDGTAAYPYPKSRSVFVHYDGNVYSPDTSHYLPGKGGDPIEILEVQQQHDYFNTEYVEDYGYSHGTMSDFISPGQSNAIDGYITYEVPESLTPEATYVEIVFDSEASAIWRLA